VILRSTYWQFADPSNTDVLASQGPTVYATGDNCPPLPGTGCGTATATYRAQKPGSSTITATRAACNETLRCTPDDMQFRLDVKVTA
jgi:hypothetical protein